MCFWRIFFWKNRPKNKNNQPKNIPRILETCKHGQRNVTPLGRRREGNFMPSLKVEGQAHQLIYRFPPPPGQRFQLIFKEAFYQKEKNKNIFTKSFHCRHFISIIQHFKDNNWVKKLYSLK